MILLNADPGLLILIISIYLIAHSPAIITLIIGLSKLKSKPTVAKKYLIFTGIYFIIGGGICGSLLT